MNPSRWQDFNWRNFIYKRLQDHGKGLKILTRLAQGKSNVPNLTEVNDTEDLNAKISDLLTLPFFPLP